MTRARPASPSCALRRWVSEELVDGRGEPRDVTRRNQGRGAFCDRPGLLQVERDERQAERHVLDSLDRRYLLLEARIQSQVCRGEVPVGVGFRQPPRERDAVGQSAFIDEVPELIQTLTVAHDRDRHVALGSSFEQLADRRDDEVDAILSPHLPDPADQMIGRPTH